MQQKMKHNNIVNPFKKTSPLDDKCIFKSIMALVAGGAMGFVMAMFMNAVEMRGFQYGQLKKSTSNILRKDIKRMFSTAKGFAIFGGFFVFYQCLFQHMRMKQDGLNSFVGGGLTSVTLAADVMRSKQLMWSGIGGGIMCYLFYKAFKYMGY